MCVDNGECMRNAFMFRPLSDEEIKAKTPVAVSCNELKREVTIFQNTGTKQIDKTFVFDKV